jgi:hypothetical protein
MFKFQKISTLIAFLFGFFALQAQTKILKNGDNVSIQTKDGAKYSGSVQSMTDEEITLEQFKSGTKITVKKKNVHLIRNIAAPTTQKNSEYDFENPNATRYLFAPSSLNLRKGEGYYQNAYIGANMVSYGITDRFTVGGGLELFTTLAGSPTLMLTSKFNYPISEKLNIGAGALFLNLGSIQERISAGIVFGTATVGDRETNATVGAGWGFFKNSISTGSTNSPIVTICGMTRLAPHWALVSENWIVTEREVQFGILSLGARYMRESFTIDFALWRPVAADAANNDIGLFAVPYLDIVIPFGKR